MKKIPTKKRFFIIVTALVILLGIFIGLYFTYKYLTKKKTATVQDNTQQYNQDNTSQNNSSTTDAANPTQPATQPTANSQPSSPTKPQSPTLAKSSGNNGPIPPNVLVNFVCNDQAGLSCQIILTNQNGQQVVLPAQTIQDSGRGQYSTNWNWTSVAGTWTVVARAKNSQGATSDSDKQALVVK